MKLTPAQIFDYKLQWMAENPSYNVQVHSDARRDALAWCKQNLEPYQYKQVFYTNVYEDTIFFETLHFKERFTDEFILPRRGHR